ncbi:MAG: DUF433 domain-containing protein [Gemmataceae bacterium]
MQLEDYFEFEKLEMKHGPVERIRLKGHRIDIDQVIDAFNEGKSAERIRQRFPTLSLEEVYATITYYLHNKTEMDAYIERGTQVEEAYYQEWLGQGLSPTAQRLKELKAQRQQSS